MPRIHTPAIETATGVTAFTNVFNRINDTEVDFPAVA